MRRGLLVVAQSGAVTSLNWWSQLKVLGDAVILQCVSEDGPVQVLTVGEPGSQAEARDLFAAINGRIRQGGRYFDVQDWIARWRSEGPPAAGTNLPV